MAAQQDLTSCSVRITPAHGGLMRQVQDRWTMARSPELSASRAGRQRTPSSCWTPQAQPPERAGREATVCAGTGDDTLVGADGENQWVISDTDSGTLNSQTFTGIENLRGGGGNDVFTVTESGQVTGVISG